MNLLATRLLLALVGGAVALALACSAPEKKRSDDDDDGKGGGGGSADGGGGASAGGAGGAGGSAGGGGGTGGSPSGCDATGVCDECQQCAFTAECQAEHDTCQANPECGAFNTCIGDCNTKCGGDTACIGPCQDDCKVAHATGVDDQNALVNCLFCGACTTSCPEQNANCP